jgi:hypothetical protein
VTTGLSGNFEATVHVDSVQNVNAWTKAGIMFRDTIGPGSRHVSIFATPGKGIAFQRRLTADGISTHTAGPLIAAPLWLRLVRFGTSICGYYRKNTTDAWSVVACQTIATDAMNVGLAVTSHVKGTTATAKFSNVRVGRLPTITGTAVGGATGSATFDGTTFTVTGKGTDIWGTSDQFFFANTLLTGDGSITARVRSVQNTHVWAKAGVMIRDTIDASSKHVDIVVTPGKGVAMQYRPQTGGLSFMQTQIAGAAPGWVSLSRQGTTFTAAFSKDGVTWSTSTVQVTMSPTVLIGLAVTSHNTAVSTKAVFDDVVWMKQ